MAHQIRILHISDTLLSASPRNPLWHILGESWEKNLEDIRADGPVDLVALTGDVSSTAQEKEYEIATSFVDVTLQRLGLSRDRLFVVPGNHDIDRAIQAKAWSGLRSIVRGVPPMELSRWMAGGPPPMGLGAEVREQILEREAVFRRWVTRMSGLVASRPGWSSHLTLGYRVTLRLPGRPFACHVIGLDSAWSSGDDTDSGNLWLTEDQVFRLTTDEQGRKLGGFRVALVHHPLSSLADGAHCERALDDSVDLLLHGHAHQSIMVSHTKRRALRVLGAGRLNDHLGDASCQVLDVTLDDAGRPLGYRLWFRRWSVHGHWYDDDSVYRESRSGRLAWTDELQTSPQPRPVRRRKSFTMPRPSFHVRSLQIRNLKNISELSLDLNSHSTLPGCWQCIAGVNGTGKSTVLQALACVLLGDRLAQELGGGRLRDMCRRQADGEARTDISARIGDGETELELFLPLGHEGVDITRLELHESYGAMREFWDWRAHHHLLVSYGAGRNLSESVDASLDKYSPDVRAQLSLFEPFAPVAHADVLTRKGLLPRVVMTALQQLLEHILKDSPVQISPSTEPLQFLVNGALVQASELPDGFRSLVAWLADLCADWYQKAPQDAESGDLGRLRGIVLIDEIDLHLHPRLQRTLVPRLRQLLPEVQWVVTTHSPLVLASFDRSEITPLAGYSGGVRQLDRQILGFTTDEVYRWLLETEPTSAALEMLWAQQQRPQVREELGLLLAQTPEVDEERARRNREWLKQRVEELRQKQPHGDDPT